MSDLLIKLAEIKDVLASMDTPPPYKIKMTRECYKQLLAEAESRWIVLRKGDGFDRIFGIAIEVEP